MRGLKMDYKATFVYVDEDCEEFDAYFYNAVAFEAKKHGIKKVDTIAFNYVFVPNGSIAPLNNLTDQENSMVAVILDTPKGIIRIDFFKAENDVWYYIITTVTEEDQETMKVSDPTMLDKHDGNGYVKIGLDEDEYSVCDGCCEKC